MNELPEYFFRVRENGAVAFRVDTENRQRRIEMEQIAIINTNRGDFKAHGSYELTGKDSTAIQNWLDDRMKMLAQRQIDDIHRAIDHMNMTAQWVQSKASDDDLDQVTEGLLLAMHDLRSALVRKKADRVKKD